MTDEELRCIIESLEGECQDSEAKMSLSFSKYTPHTCLQGNREALLRLSSALLKATLTDSTSKRLKIENITHFIPDDAALGDTGKKQAFALSTVRRTEEWSETITTLEEWMTLNQKPNRTIDFATLQVLIAMGFMIVGVAATVMFIWALIAGESPSISELDVAYCSTFDLA